MDSHVDLLFTQFALIGHALSNPHRLRLLQILSQAEKTVEALAEMTQQSVASTSAHLKVLRSACLVDSRKSGRFVYYRLSSDSVLRLWMALRQLGEETMPEVREVVRAYFDDPESLLKLTPQELLEGVRQGRFMLVDVRPTDEYAAGHIPGAESVPAEELTKRLKSLPRDRRIVAYCRGPFCVTAVEAVKRLRAQGLNAMRVGLGVAEFRLAGLELERTAPETPSGT